jgi:hypothetical protein
MKQFILTTVMAITALLGVATIAPPAYAGTPSDQVTKGINAADANSGAKNCGPDGAKRACGLGDSIQTVINVLLFIIGVVSVIMIIIGGIRYTISNGDSSQVTSAKNTILYAVIGLILALLAYAIVNFVIDSFVKKPSETSAVLQMTS